MSKKKIKYSLTLEFEHDKMDKNTAIRLGKAYKRELEIEIQDNNGALYLDDIDKHGYHIKDIDVYVDFLEVLEEE